MANNSAIEMFKTIINTNTLSGIDLEKAKEIFREYKAKEIILSGEFEDDHWYFSDEYSNLSIRFSVPEFTYKKYYYPIWDLSPSEFIIHIKYYVLMMLGQLVLSTIRVFIYDLTTLLKQDPESLFNDEEGASLFLQRPWSISEFISLLPESNDPERVELLLNGLDNLTTYRQTLNTQRQLSSFESYFLFNDIIKDYWSMDLDKDERLFYYPLYLWWEITAVIPMRPREFILTQRNCLYESNGSYFLKLRKNRIKGPNKTISYKIEDDYEVVSYRIPDRLAKQILDYLEFTKEYDNTELETLFVSDPHYRKWNQKKHSNSRYFTYINLSCVMRYFYEEVIERIYHLHVIYEAGSKRLSKGCIEYIHLGDTRHIAMINLIAEGGTPVLAMMLAGHDSIEMSSHYYSNIINLLECRTHKQYRKVLRGNVTYSISKYNPQQAVIKPFIQLEDNGYCYSEKVINGSCEDCLNSSGPNGEIGYCPKCTYYRNSDNSADFFKNEDVYKQNIEAQCKELEQAVKMVRNFNGNKEDILQVLLKLEHTSYEYSQYLKEKNEREEDTNA